MLKEVSIEIINHLAEQDNGVPAAGNVFLVDLTAALTNNRQDITHISLRNINIEAGGIFVATIT